MATISKEEARGRLAVRADKVVRVIKNLDDAEEALDAAVVDARGAGLSSEEIDKIIARQRREGH